MIEHRIGDADPRDSVLPERDSVRAGIGAEVVIERAILLHDEDEVLERGGAPVVATSAAEVEDRSEPVGWI